MVGGVSWDRGTHPPMTEASPTAWYTLDAQVACRTLETAARMGEISGAREEVTAIALEYRCVEKALQSELRRAS